MSSAVLFSTLFLEDQNFSFSSLLENRSHDDGSIEVWLADLNVPILVQQQHPLEPNLGPDLGLELLDSNPFTGRGLNLFSTAFKNRVQELSSPLLTVEIPLFYGAETPLSTRLLAGCRPARPGGIGHEVRKPREPGRGFRRERGSSSARGDGAPRALSNFLVIEPHPELEPRLVSKREIIRDGRGEVGDLHPVEMKREPERVQA